MANLTYSESMLRAVRTAIQEAIVSGTKSATINAGGGSESYTRHSLAELQELEQTFAARVNAESGFTKRTAPDFGRCHH